MGIKLSEEKIKQIPILYNELRNKAEVARQLEISVASVNKYLTLMGAAPIKEEVSATKKERKRAVVTPELIEQINSEYALLKNQAEVARKLGISTTTVRKYLSDENKELNKTLYDDRDALWYYIIRLFGPEDEETPVSSWNITQMIKFKNQGMPYRGQLLTLKYFFEIKKNPIEKANRSIGIVSHVFSEAAAYYSKLESKQKEIGDMIKEQLEKDRVEIKYSPSDYLGYKGKKKKKLIDLNSI